MRRYEDRKEDKGQRCEGNRYQRCAITWERHMIAGEYRDREVEKNKYTHEISVQDTAMKRIDIGSDFPPRPIGARSSVACTCNA